MYEKYLFVKYLNLCAKMRNPHLFFLCWLVVWPFFFFISQFLSEEFEQGTFSSLMSVDRKTLT